MLIPNLVLFKSCQFCNISVSIFSSKLCWQNQKKMSTAIIRKSLYFWLSKIWAKRGLIVFFVLLEKCYKLVHIPAYFVSNVNTIFWYILEVDIKSELDLKNIFLFYGTKGSWCIKLYKCTLKYYTQLADLINKCLQNT